jgi:exosome complex component RRP42
MGPSLLFSPSQLAYLHTSLSLQPPIRPDARSPTTFRSLRAETDLLPAANGSARVCFAEGGEAVVGVRAEVEHTVARRRDVMVETGDDDDDDGEEGRGEDSWVEVVIEQREDDAEGVVLAEMLREALLADGDLRNRLVIGSRWHWRLVVDVGCVLFLTSWFAVYEFYV